MTLPMPPGACPKPERDAIIPSPGCDPWVATWDTTVGMKPSFGADLIVPRFSGARKISLFDRLVAAAATGDVIAGD